MKNKKKEFNPIPSILGIGLLLLMPLVVVIFCETNMSHRESLKEGNKAFCIGLGLSSILLLNLWYRFTKENQRNGK